MPAASPRSPLATFWRWFAASFLGVLLLCTAWSGANPITASPDEGQHDITAYAVTHGEIGELEATVPATYADLTLHEKLWCPHVNHNNTPLCQNWAAPLTQPDRATFSQFATYNPLYYAIVGWPSLILPAHAAFYAIRELSAIFFSAIIAAAIALGSIAFRARWAAVGVVLALPPTVLFLGGMANPNSIEIALAILVWVGLLALFSRDLPRPVQRIVITVTALGGVLLVLNRLLSPLWLVIIVLTVAFATHGWRRLGMLLTRSRYFQLHVAALVIAGLLAAWWDLRHPAVFVGNVDHPAQGLRQLLDLTTDKIFTGFSGTILPQSFGILDLYIFGIPALVPVFSIIWGSVVVAAFVAARSVAGRLAPVLLVLFWVVFPSVLTAAVWGVYGWQGRYGLPIAVGVPILSLFLLGDRFADSPRVRPLIGRALRAATVVILSCNAIIFVINVHRYAIGSTRSWNPLRWQWQPPLGIAVWAIILVLGSVILALVVWRLTRSPGDGSEQGAELRRPFRRVGAGRATQPDQVLLVPAASEQR